MNKHTKMAFLVAPFLAILGWVASDIWLDNASNDNSFFTLSAEADYCDVLAKNCILYAGDVKLSLYIENDKTVLNSTHPLDDATLFLIDNTDNVKPYRLGLMETPYYWYHITQFKQNNALAGSKQKFRVLVTIDNSKYAGEFVSTTLGTSINNRAQ